MSDIKYIGIDVGKLDLLAVYKNVTKGGKFKVKYRAFPHDTKGVLALIRWSNKLEKSNQVVQLCMEATGSYRELCATMLYSVYEA